MLNLREVNRKSHGIKNLWDNTLVGLGVYDSLANDILDPDTGEVYPALSCCNDKVMADRCPHPGAEKVIWSVKANAAFNSACAIQLREGFKSGRVRLLINEYDADQVLGEVRGYKSLDPSAKLNLQLPYLDTTLLIDETVKLQHEESGGKIKVYERAGNRKDRYSSLSYNYYVATILESKKRRKAPVNSKAREQFMFRAPKIRSERR